MPNKIKTTYYYALVLEVYRKWIFIIRSEEYSLIQNKLRNLSMVNGYCYICSKEAVDKVLEDGYEWCTAGTVHLFGVGQNFKVYIHKTDSHSLPGIHVQEYGINFKCDKIIEKSKNMISLDKSRIPYREVFLTKKCKVSLVLINE